MSIPYEEKATSALAALGLKVAAEQLDSTAQQAAAGDWSYSHFLGYLLEGETAERHRKLVAFSLKLSHLPYVISAWKILIFPLSQESTAGSSMNLPREDSFMKEETLFF